MFDELLKKVCQSLDKHQIPYMLSGSSAIGFYAAARTTRDIDIVVQLKRTDVDVFLSEFKEFYFNRATIEEEIKRQGMFNLIDPNSVFKVDFIIMKNSEYGAEAFSRRKKLELNGFHPWVISLEDLILAKLLWIQDYESDRQISDIKSLIVNSQLDSAYLSYWVKKLQLKTYGLDRYHS